ncbi:MAG TPA: hypothetical protein VNO31_29695 [Umezawaea sp.]|nr:hypothetical protein [Umezawaea sp.]
MPLNCENIAAGNWLTAPEPAPEDGEVAVDERPSGDMVFWDRPAHHVALYIGTLNQIPYMVEAPQSGDVVKVSPVRTTASDFDSLVVRAGQRRRHLKRWGSR